MAFGTYRGIDELFKYSVYFKIIKSRMSSQQIQETQTTQIAGFIAKTFQILSNQQFLKIAYWAPSGTEFVIKDVNKFQQIVLPRYFRHSKMNSFIRQLNMYGFHKSRADHSKSVFSHPAFIKGRSDLLITIKRKIKGKLDVKPETVMETPMKKRQQVEVNTTVSKRLAESGHELNTVKNFCELTNNISFNILGTKQKLNSLMNLNFSVNMLPPADMGEIKFDRESEDLASIADKIDMKERQEELRQPAAPSFRFMNPSCFFQSMKKGG